MAEYTMIYKSTLLKERKWTESLIKKYYPIPDDEVENPHNKDKSSYLYYLDNVIFIENSENFQKDFNNKINCREKLKIATTKRMAKKKEEGINQAKELDIKVERIEFPEVYRRAIDSYNHHHQESIERGKRDYLINWKDLDRDFLTRITVNYIRHNLTSYEDYCNGLYKKVGRDDIYDVIRDKVISKILEVYPELIHYRALEQEIQMSKYF